MEGEERWRNSLLYISIRHVTLMTVSEVQRVAGVAPIKPEYLVVRGVEATILAEDAVVSSTKCDEDGQSKPRARGLHHNRNRVNRTASACNVKRDGLCPELARGDACSRGPECRFDHDLPAFLATRPVDIGTECPLIALQGHCKFGLLCRFGSSHPPPSGIAADASASARADALIAKLDAFRRKELRFPATQRYLRSLPPRHGAAISNPDESSTDQPAEPSSELPAQSVAAPAALTAVAFSSPALLEDGWRRQRRSADFCEKLYLAPLTTVGNLPFRRICKEYGVDITCGEMALCTNLLKGQASEWALLRRHESEDFFGVQLCGGWTDSMTQCAELLNDHIDCDFVDVNMGCPIDLVFRKGMGSGLMDRTGRVRQIVAGMRTVLPSKPLTVKMRIGIEDGKPLAQRLLPDLASLGIDALTIHGRTRQQRYTKEADWGYIAGLVQTAASHNLPIIGNGDVLSWEDYEARKAASGAHSMMIARGALIKPWIFTEIKERRYWDIRSAERLEMLRRHVRYGLEHFGSDTAGVERTRRFLLEWLSFLCRYVPVGILAELPPRINDRPPAFVGRDDLETLMASPAVQDWIKISEMLLGPVADDFVFLPKHKSNSYEQPLSANFGH